MDDRALTALHTELSQRADNRGKSGGLGHVQLLKKDKDKRTNKKKNQRGFETTTAAAIAAGHWDPWARPVEFQMRAANKPGKKSLYEMFVRGDVMGGTAEAEPPRPPPSQPSEPSDISKSATGFKWKRAIRGHVEASVAGPIDRKTLRKAVVRAASAHGGGGMPKAKLRDEFRRQLKRMCERDVALKSRLRGRSRDS